MGAAVARQPPVTATAIDTLVRHLDGRSLLLFADKLLPTAPARTKTLGSPQKFVC